MTGIQGSCSGPAQRRDAAMAGHYHAVVRIDRAKGRIFHFNVDLADRTVIRPDHEIRDIHHRAKRTGHRVVEDRQYFEDVTHAVADAGAILIVWPGEEKRLSRSGIPRLRGPYRRGRIERPSDRRRAPRRRPPLRQGRGPHAPARRGGSDVTRPTRSSLAAQEMRAGPSDPDCRIRVQTTASCAGTTAGVVSVAEKANVGRPGVAPPTLRPFPRRSRRRASA